MNSSAIIHVKIGELHLAREGQTLKAILGSCVGIGILWKERRIYALAHCLLPKSPTRLYTLGARFVNQAVPSLMAIMKIQPEHLSQVTAIVVGGGNMTAPQQSTETLVGTMNFEAALEALAAAGIQVVHHEAGGATGRQVEIDGTTGAWQIREIPRIES